MLLPDPLGPTSPIISPGSIVRSTFSIDLAIAVTEADAAQLDFAADSSRVHRHAGSGTLGTRSRISKMRCELAAARCVIENIRLIDSSRV